MHPIPPTVEVDFEAVVGGTVVRLQEASYQDTPSGRKAMLNCATGWGQSSDAAQVLSGTRAALFTSIPVGRPNDP